MTKDQRQDVRECWVSYPGGKVVVDFDGPPKYVDDYYLLGRKVHHFISVESYDAVCKKYDELLSVLPKVPTQPYERELAKRLLETEDDLRAAKDALEKIASMKNMTRLADCCVERSCHINAESDMCSFQTGVLYGNADRAGDAAKALAKLAKFPAQAKGKSDG